MEEPRRHKKRIGKGVGMKRSREKKEKEKEEEFIGSQDVLTGLCLKISIR